MSSLLRLLYEGKPAFLTTTTGMQWLHDSMQVNN
jgi:hypothetical protein